MTNSDLTPPAGGDEAQQARTAFWPTLGASIQYMRESAAVGLERAADNKVAALLPVSCVLLIAAVLLPVSPLVKAFSFVAPSAALFYYIGTRLGIVRTFNARQAFLMWHILIATFMLGGALTMFFLALSVWIFQALRI